MALGGILNAMSVENKPGGIVWNAQQGGVGSTGGIGTSLKQDLASGEARMNSAVGAAQSGLNAILGMGAQIKNDSNAMRGQAGLVNQQGNAVNADANALSALVPKLDPYAQKLGGYGDDLAAWGKSLSEQAKDVFGQGEALVKMDPNAGGLAGEFIKYWNSLSPDRYVSQAASDAQGAIQNQTAQMERDLSRRGVSASSGAFMGLRRTAATAAAALVASAKTKARQLGLDQQAAQLDKMVSAANTLYGMGNQTQAQATGALGQAGDAQKGAADVVTAQGSLLGKAGDLRSQAGSLFGSAAGIFGNAAEVDLGYGQLTNSAYKNLTTAFESAADYYLGAARIGVSADRGAGGGGVQITQAPEDDWMNWMGTGHSQSWNRNNNPNYETLELMAAEKAK